MSVSVTGVRVCFFDERGEISSGGLHTILLCSSTVFNWCMHRLPQVKLGMQLECMANSRMRSFIYFDMIVWIYTRLKKTY